MGTSKMLVGLIAVVSFAIPARFAHAVGSPKFKEDPIRLEAKANVAFEQKLRPLLVDPQTPLQLNWSLTNAPGWLKLDIPGERLFGTPTNNDAGVFDFRGVTVNSDEGGDFNHRIVLSVFAPPKWSSPDIDLGIQNEDTPWTFDLKTVVTDPSGGTLTITATGLPSWMTLNGTVLSGTPRRKDVGSYSGIVFTATGKGGSANANGHGKVLKTIHPPKWTAKEIKIDDAFEDKAYNRNVVEFALNPEGTQLNYEIVSMTPPPWLSLGATSGTLFGTPKKANIGPVSVAVILRTTIDGQKFDDTTTFKFNVVHVNHPPEWRADPIKLPDGLTKVAYSQDLGKSAFDPDDGDKLAFKIVSFTGPGNNWATIDASTGVFKGTPQKENLGDNSWLVSVTDQAGLSDTATVTMKVNKSNEPPFWKAKPTVLKDAKEDQAYEVDLDDFATDPDADPLTYTKLDGPSWFTISSSGVLMGTPKASDVGLISFRVKVDDRISGSDVTDVKILIVHTNHNPDWLLNPVVFTVKEDQAVNLDIAPFAKDPDVGDSLSFQVLEGPAWATLSSKGVFTGTPTRPNVGDNNYRVRVSDQAGGFKDGNVLIKVLKVNKKPFWTQNPIQLTSAKEGQFYSASVFEFAKDPDNDTLSFSKVSGPAWVTVGSNGTISGTPQRGDVGLNHLEVRVMDPFNEFATTNVRIEVEKVNQPPRWRQNPILMGEALEDTTFNFNLADFAIDDDGDPLSFKLISFTGPGSAWMFVGADGKITGVPMKGNLGKFTAVFEVSDGQLQARTNGQGEVVHKNHPPICSPELPQFRMKEREIFTVNLAQPQYVSDPDGDTLNFVFEQTVDPWVSLTAAGVAKADRPQRKDVGAHQWNFKVDDGQIPIHCQLQILVLKDPRPPVWLFTPVTDKAKTNEPYASTLADKAKDLDGERLTFSKLSGPAWLTVASSGATSGTPREGDLGANTFKVQACNESGLCTPNDLIITVEPGTKEDIYIVDTPVANAKAENLWVVDNSSHCDKTIKELKKYIGVYFTELSAQQFPIQHSGVYLSSDAHKWDGLPIRAPGQAMLMKWTDPNQAGEFNKRVDEGYSSGACGNCYNSPIWTMFRFYNRLEQGLLNEIYHNGYMMPDVPMDAMMISNQKDHFPWYSKNTPQKPWTAADYANNFIAFHTKEKKAYRVSAIAPACPHELLETSGDDSAAAPENAYRVVVDKTGGRYYLAGCNLDMAAYLRDYAKRVIFRAYVHAKHRIRLSATPIQTNTIELRIGEVLIPGNTGSASDKWSYDAGSNEVIINWFMIDQGQIKPGDTIKIKFRVS